MSCENRSVVTYNSARSSVLVWGSDAV